MLPVPAPPDGQRPLHALAPWPAKPLEREGSVACGSAVDYRGTKRLSLRNNGWCPGARAASWHWGQGGTTHRSLPWRSVEGKEKCTVAMVTGRSKEASWSCARPELDLATLIGLRAVITPAFSQHTVPTPACAGHRALQWVEGQSSSCQGRVRCPLGAS